MAKKPFFSLLGPDEERAVPAPLGGSRAEAMHRLQVGLTGLGGMILLVGLASVIQDRARVADSLSVPEAAPTTEPSASAPLSDPLADAGVVPDLPAEPDANPQHQATQVPADGAQANGNASPQ